MDLMRKVPDRPGDLREWFLRSQQERTICSVKRNTDVYLYKLRKEQRSVRNQEAGWWKKDPA